MLLTLVYSFRNEDIILETLISKTAAELEKIPIDFEMIFVNDDSNDRSLAILKEQINRDNRIRVITMSRRFGVTPCIMAGLRHSKGDLVIVMAADLQDPPELIPKMVSLFKNGSDVVNTVRTTREGENPFKMWLTRRIYKVINWISDIPLQENAGDFKLLSRRVVNEVVRLNEYYPYTRGLVPWAGFRQEELSYKSPPRYAGRSKQPILKSRDPFNQLVAGLTSFSELPLYLALILGIISSGASALYLLYIVAANILGLHVPDWSTLMIIALLLGGMILFTNGILGLYIGRIFNNVKGRPPYIIEDKIGFDGK